MAVQIEKSGSEKKYPTESATENFYNLKYYINEVVKNVGTEINDGEQTALTLVVLQSILGEEKMNRFLNLMNIKNSNELN